MWFHVVHHVMMLLIVAFFVLFAASKAEGLVKLLGMIIGLVLLVGAVLHIVFAVVGPEKLGMHGDWMHHDGMHHDGTMGEGGDSGPQPAPPPAKH